ncbi:MAG: aldo/keto reductase [Gammaproteobacteria bacterium]
MSASEGSNFSRRTLIKSGVYATVGFAVARAGVVGAADKSLPLITKTVPSTKEKLPVIGIGTNNFGVTAADELAARRDVIKMLPELGGAIIDTAQAYGASEQVIGDSMAAIGNRSKLFIATKTPLAGNVSDAKATLEKSFAALKTDKIDLLQIHNVHGIDELLPLYKDYKKAGRIRYIGVTTSVDSQYAELVAAMKKYDFDFVQVDYSMQDRSAEKDVFPVAQDKGMGVLVNMPLGGRRGSNLMQKVAGKELPKWAADLDVTSWAQFFLKYDISHPVVTAAIPGTTKVSHLEDNQKAGRGRLPDAATRKKMEELWESIST